METSKITLTVEETAEQLGISRALAYRLIHKDDFPVLRLGRRVVIPIDELNNWIRLNVENRQGKQV